MCALYHAPLLPRKQIHYTLSTTEARNNDMLRDLIRLGHVGITDALGRRCCYLTESGLKELYRLYNIAPEPDTVHIAHHAAKKERNLRVGQMVNLLQAADINTFEHSKPHLETLIAIMNGRPLGDIEDNWSALRPGITSNADLPALLSKGIFYPSSVIKRALKRRGIKEPTKSSRMVGVLLLQEDIFMCYSTLNRMMQFDDATEKAACEYILGLFTGYEPYHKYAEVHAREQPDALILAQSMEMLPALVTGHKGGVYRSPRVLKYRRKYNFLSAKCKLFRTIFFFSTDRYSVERLRLASHLSRSRRAEDVQSFFDAAQPYGYIFTGELPYLQAYHQPSGLPAVCFPFYDLMQLYSLRSNNQQLIVLLPDGHEEYIARIFGPLLKAAFSFEHKLLPTSEYTIRGEKIDEVAT